MDRVCATILISFLLMIFILMTFFPQGNINGAGTLIPKEKQGTLYWAIASLAIVAIPIICYLIIKFGYKNEIYPQKY